VGEQGTNQRTTELKAIVQELVNRSGWVSGNAMAFIITGTGHRTARSVDGSASGAPMLHVEIGTGSSTNNAPNVNAGLDQTVVFPLAASLDGTVTDDGQPGPLSYTWSKVSGPGTVTFVNANAVDTQATFGASGTYVLQLLASDGQLSGSDQVQIMMQPPSSGGTTFERRVLSSGDDAEEFSSGTMSLTSSDLEMVNDGGAQTVGLRFTGVGVPKGATILNAWIEFETDEAQSETTNLTIQGQAADDPGTFTSTSGNVSSRSRTSVSAAWSPPAWSTIGEAGLDQRTTNLTAIVQELVNRSGWVSGNAMVFIITGTGHRTAQALDQTTAGAPLLHIEY
jgi:hypothetical protein